MGIRTSSNFASRLTTSSRFPCPKFKVGPGLLKHRLDDKNLNDILEYEPTMEAIVSFVRRNWKGPDLVFISVSRPTLGASAEWSAP
jgi:hypothetical protein